MPSDLRSPAPRPTASPRPRRSLVRVFLVGFLTALYALAALRFDLPPVNWIQRGLATYRNHGQEAAILRQRPALKGTERYSPQHRYRPAASPIITQGGKVNGEYY
ncbi:hypothetical protein JCM10207_006067 [Rhodosporidiobolus poonsookiae]